MQRSKTKHKQRGLTIGKTTHFSNKLDVSHAKQHTFSKETGFGGTGTEIKGAFRWENPKTDL